MKQRLIAATLALGLALIALFYRGVYSPTRLQENLTSQINQNQEVKIISTNPSPLEDATILPTQTVEITFNYPLINKDEFKNRLDPPQPITIDLSEDKKTVRITPVKPYPLGSGGFTLFILPDSKFISPAGKIVTKEQIIYHFKTISYRGV